MNTKSPTNSPAALDTLACVNEGWTLYGQKGQDNLTVRKRSRNSMSCELKAGFLQAFVDVEVS